MAKQLVVLFLSGKGLEWVRGLSCAHQVMDDVGQGPDDRNAEEGDAEESHMQQSYQDDIGQPDAPAVHHSRVGIHFTVRYPHIHPARVRGWARQESNSVSSQPLLRMFFRSCL